MKLITVLWERTSLLEGIPQSCSSETSVSLDRLVRSKGYGLEAENNHTRLKVQDE